MKIRRLNLKIVAGIAAVLLPALVAFFLVLYHLHRNQMIQAMAESAAETNVLLQVGLEHAMLDRDPALLRRAVEALGRQPGVEQVLLLNSQGIVRFASDSTLLYQKLSPQSPGCSQCHRPHRASSGAIPITLTGGRRVLRSVSVVANREPCFSCHGSQARTNGIMVIDFAMGPVESRLAGDVKRMLALSLGMTGVMIALLWLLLSRTVVARVRTLSKTAQAITRGDLRLRARVQGRDEIADLAERFNEMTGSLAASMDTVQAQREHLETLINGMDDGIVVVDRNLVVAVANRAYRQRFEQPDGEIIGAKCYFLTDPSRVGRLCQEPGKCPARETFKTGNPQQALHIYQSPDGETSFLDVHASPLRNEAGEVVQVIEVWRDLTERKRLEAQLEHSERLASLGLLASGVAHEINNPLAAIQACVEGLQRRMRSGEGPEGAGRPGDWERYLRTVEEELGRMKGITERLLSIARKPRRRPDAPETGGADVNRCLSETMSLVAFQAQQDGIRVEQDLGPGPYWVDGDETAVRQVILNLVLNAIQAIPEGSAGNGRGTIRLSTRQEDRRVVLRVKDSGRGIERSKLAKVFEPFYSEGTRGGTGLGLFIVKTIVEGQGGSVEVSSDPGAGSEFIVSWPVQAGKESGPVHKES